MLLLCLCILLTVQLLDLVSSQDDVISVPTATFPLQFSGTLDITSHLIPEDSDYPPHKRSMRIMYDYVNRRARVHIDKGYEAEKYYIRRYDKKEEYMVRLPPINDCKRSYLGETMPFPDLSEAEYLGIVEIDEITSRHYLFVEDSVVVHIYLSVHDNAPVRLDQLQVHADGRTSPLLTYQYSDVSLGPPAERWFELKAPFGRSNCTRHVGGFPYLHIFHYLVKI